MININTGKRVKFLWALVFSHLVLVSIGSIAKILHWTNWEYILLPGFICFFISWFVILTEMINIKIYNKTFWLLSMFVFPTFSPVVYMIRRERLIRFIEPGDQELNLFH